MKNIISELKGKSFLEGRKIVEENFVVDEKRTYTNFEDGCADMYIYKENDDNWICFSSSYEEVEGDEAIIDMENGYWNISFDGEYATEKEI